MLNVNNCLHFTFIIMINTATESLEQLALRAVKMLCSVELSMKRLCIHEPWVEGWNPTLLAIPEANMFNIDLPYAVSCTHLFICSSSFSQ